MRKSLSVQPVTVVIGIARVDVLRLPGQPPCVYTLKRASKKYQSTRAGRFNNAGRQKRYRERQKQKVTHQCSPPVTSHDVLKNKRIGPEKAEKQDQMGTGLLCHHCGAVCGPFLRQDFLHHSRFLRLFRNPSAFERRP